MQGDFWVKNGVLGENGCAKELLGQNWGMGEMGVQRDFWVKLGF